ncbi:MAG: smalltalk protein [Prevotella sp.]|nr:smalltalk protein [Prevotella sp.]
MVKKETVKFIVQLIVSIASAILTVIGTASCMGL